MIECEHGQLARSCNLCEYEREIAELLARVRELEAERDADRRREYGYSQQTVDALTLERDRLTAENERLRELVDGETEAVELSDLAAWLKRAAKAMKEASHE